MWRCQCEVHKLSREISLENCDRRSAAGFGMLPLCIVDYRWTLTGELADVNSDGVPDSCQQPTCHDADLLNGTDLGEVLANAANARKCKEMARNRAGHRIVVGFRRQPQYLWGL